MAVSDKIKALMKLKGRKSTELAAYLGMTPQAMRNKFSRDSFSAYDLIKVSDFLDCSLYFELKENQKIVLEMADMPDTKT